MVGGPGVCGGGIIMHPHHCRYGGIQLGPDRFKHINNVARIIIQESGLGLEVRT